MQVRSLVEEALLAMDKAITVETAPLSAHKTIPAEELWQRLVKHTTVCPQGFTVLAVVYRVFLQASIRRPGALLADVRKTTIPADVRKTIILADARKTAIPADARKTIIPADARKTTILADAHKTTIPVVALQSIIPAVALVFIYP